MRIQNRPDLYENRPTTLGAVLIPTGVYPVILADVQSFDSSHGTRLALTFEVIEGAHAGERLTESATINARGKLAELVEGMGEMRGLSLESLRGLIGHRCRILVRHDQTKAGTPFARVAMTLR